MKNYLKYILLSALMLPLFAGCGDSDDWTPGPQDTDTGVKAYFSPTEKTSFIFDSEGKAEDMNVLITVYRNESSEASSIPVVFTAETEGFTAPATADFAAGESSATLSVNCSGIDKGREIAFTLTLPENQTDIYGEGLNSVTCKVIKSEWKLIADNVRYIYSYSDYSQMYPATYSKMYHLDGTTMFKLVDFFSSGIDVNFECASTNPTAFLPLNNAMFGVAPAGYEGLECWYLYNEEEQTYPVWTPGDADGYPAINDVLFYGLSSFTTIYMNYYPENLYGYIAFTCDVNFDNGDFAWGAWQADFNLKYNPFE